MQKYVYIVILFKYKIFKDMEEKFYNGKKNEDLAHTYYFLAAQYGKIGQYDKALQSYEELLGKRAKQI